LRVAFLPPALLLSLFLLAHAKTPGLTRPPAARWCVDDGGRRREKERKKGSFSVSRFFSRSIRWPSLEENKKLNLLFFPLLFPPPPPPNPPSQQQQTDAASLDAPSLPVNYEPHDSLRLGLPAYKEDFAAPHPHPVAAVVAAAASSSGGDDARRMRALADVYGAGLAARHSIEKQILTR